jgi:NADPH:quinone reductase-like Zn-dependent oxidoreductase
MKAAYITETGDPDVLAYGELPEPQLASPNDVLVRVRATSLNRRDVFAREGSHGTRPARFPYVPGLDVAGEVLTVGDAVTRFKAGDRVMGEGSATYAQIARAREDTLVMMPASLSFEEAASIPTVFSAAYHMLVCRAKLSIGETMLVMAGGSGVGSAAIQIGRAMSARILTTASSDDKLQRARELGARVGINYREQDFAERVREETNGEGVDLVFEHIGTPVWEGCFASLKRGGRLVTCGVTAGYLVTLHLGQLWTRDLTLIGTSQRPAEDLAEIVRLVDQGIFRGVVDSMLPLEAANEAHRRLEASDFFGKIVLTVP